MTTLLVKEVMEFFAHDIFQWERLSPGESKRLLDKAVRQGVPLLVADILSKAKQPHHAAIVLRLARQAYLGDGLPALTGSRPLKLDLGLHLLQRLFGENLSLVTTMFAGYARIRHTSAHSMLSLIALVTLALIGRRVAGANMDAEDLCRWLGSPHELIEQLPAGRPAANDWQAPFLPEDGISREVISV